MQNDREMSGRRLDLHCPSDEMTLRQDVDYPDRAICPCCWASYRKPALARTERTS